MELQFGNYNHCDPSIYTMDRPSQVNCIKNQTEESISTQRLNEHAQLPSGLRGYIIIFCLGGHITLYFVFASSEGSGIMTWNVQADLNLPWSPMLSLPNSLPTG